MPTSVASSASKQRQLTLLENQRKWIAGMVAKGYKGEGWFGLKARALAAHQRKKMESISGNYPVSAGGGQMIKPAPPQPPTSHVSRDLLELLQLHKLSQWAPHMEAAGIATLFALQNVTSESDLPSGMPSVARRVLLSEIMRLRGPASISPSISPSVSPTLTPAQQFIRHGSDNNNNNNGHILPQQHQHLQQQHQQQQLHQQQQQQLQQQQQHLQQQIIAAQQRQQYSSQPQHYQPSPPPSVPSSSPAMSASPSATANLENVLPVQTQDGRLVLLNHQPGYRNPVAGEEQPPEQVVLASCSICKRKFNEERLARHEDVCAKSESKKRQVFDSKVHRTADLEADPMAVKSSDTGVKRSSWRQRSEALKAGLNGTSVESEDTRVPCPHCNRRFASTTAETHIPSCGEKARRAQPARGPPQRNPSRGALPRATSSVRTRTAKPSSDRDIPSRMRSATHNDDFTYLRNGM